MPQRDIRQTFKSNQFRREEEVANDLMTVEFRDEDPTDLSTNPMRMWANKVTGEVKYTVDGVNVQGLGTKEQLADIAINVKTFGATGDGITDDTAAINEACANGGTILIPEGTYMIDGVTDSANRYTAGGIYLPDNTALILHPLAIIKVIPNDSDRYNTIRIHQGTNISIKGGTIQGDRDEHSGVTGEQGYGIAIWGGSNITVEDVYVKDCWGDGILVSRDVDSNESVNVNIRNVISNNNRRQGMSVIAVDGLVVDSCTFSNTNGTAPEAGIDIEPDQDTQIAKNIIITNSRFFGNQTGILTANRTSIEKITISNCFCYNNDGSGIAITAGVDISIIGSHCYDNGSHGISVNGSLADRVTIIGNICYSNTSHGVELSNVSYCIVQSNILYSNGSTGVNLSVATHNIVKSNQIYDNANRGIYVFSMSTDNTIEGNNVYSNGENGIYVLTSGHRTNIIGNHVHENGRNGIWVAGSAVDCIISTNHSYNNSQETTNTYDNIVLTSSVTDACIQSNTVRKGDLTNKPRYGVRIAGSIRTLVTNNDSYTGGETGGISETTSTNTMYGAGNKVLDGTFSATPS